MSNKQITVFSRSEKIMGVAAICIVSALLWRGVRALNATSRSQPPYSGSSSNE